MKTPEACSGLDDVRCGIDAMDKAIMELFGRRLAYVLAASRFKPTLESIPAPERVAAMLPERKHWAAACGLPPRFVDEVFLPVIHWYISEQTSHWKRIHGLTEASE